MKNSASLFRFIVLCSCISLLSIQSTQAQVSGIKTIPGDYFSISIAIQHITAVGLAGPTILELQSNYNSANETFPVTVGVIPGNSEINSLIISPAPGVTGLSIISANDDATFQFRGSSNVIVDGRPGRTGVARELLIRNNSITGSAVRFLNVAINNIDVAYNNTVTYCVLEGKNNNTIFSHGAVVVFGDEGPYTPGILYEAQNNTVSNCRIRGCSATELPVYGIGAETIEDVTNNNCKIINNEIADFQSAGIFIKQNGSGGGWTITGNSLFQTSVLTGPRSTQNGIIFYPGPGSFNNIISGNFIGGTAPLASGGKWTLSIHQGRDFATVTGIVIDCGSVTVQNNLMQNFYLTNTLINEFNAGGADFRGIFLYRGAADIRNNNMGGFGAQPGIELAGQFVLFEGIITNTCASTVMADNIMRNVTMIETPHPNRIGVLQFTGIWITDGYHHQITGNLIEQVNANSSGTVNFDGVLFNYTSAHCPRFPGPSALDYNLIRNISLSSSGDSVNFKGFSIPDITMSSSNNIIGSATQANSITVSGKFVNATAMLITESPDANISNNIIGNIVADGVLFSSFNGIRFQGGGIANSNANKLMGVTINSNGPADFTGISFNAAVSGSQASLLHHNQVYKVNITSSASAASFTGININDRISANTGNIIGSASASNSITVTGSSAIANGIQINNSPNVSVSDDIIANITATGNVQPGKVNGILFRGGIAVVRGNEVHHLNAPTANGISVEPVNGTSTITLDSNRLTGVNSGTGISTSVAGTASLTLIANDNTVRNWQTGVFLSSAAGATLQQTFQNNSIITNQTGFVNPNGSIVNATCNWWGHASGPGGAGPGTGNPVGTNVNFTPWATIPGYVAINAGADQTIYLGYGPSSKTLIPTVTACGTRTYLWSTGATSATITVSPVVTTNYSVTVTDLNGHSATDAVTVFVQDVRCENGKVMVCHKESTAHFKNKCIPSSAVSAHLAHGDVLGPCPGTPFAGRSVSPVDNSKDEMEESELVVAVNQNPTADHFTIRFSTGSKEPLMLQVFDLNGKIVERRNIQNTAESFELGHMYLPGIYYLRVMQGKSHSGVRLVKVAN